MLILNLTVLACNQAPPEVLDYVFITSTLQWWVKDQDITFRKIHHSLSSFAYPINVSMHLRKSVIKF